jgi:hypothetical protein
MQTNDDLELDLKLTVKDVNTILSALQDLPFKVAVHIVNKLHTQGAPQMAAAAKTQTIDAQVINNDDTNTTNPA